jgi:hypothetical protein
MAMFLGVVWKDLDDLKVKDLAIEERRRGCVFNMVGLREKTLGIKTQGW